MAHSKQARYEYNPVSLDSIQPFVFTAVLLNGAYFNFFISVFETKVRIYTHCSAIVLPKNRLVQVGKQLLLNVEQHLHVI